MIVQYVEPDFLDSIDDLPKAKVTKIKRYIHALVEEVERCETIDDLRQIGLSNMELSKAPQLRILAGRNTESKFPNRDVFLFRFDEFKLFFCLRGQVCTLLRVDAT